MASQPPNERPTSPWRPTRFRVHGVNPVTRTPTRGPKTGRTVRYYDVRYTADGFAFSMRFERKGWADAFADQLREHSALGYQFDPATRRFLEPADAVAAPTVVAFTAEYFARQWPSWSPNSRRNNQRELALACVYLLSDDAPQLDGPGRVAADRYLRRAVLVSPVVDRPEHAEDDVQWAAWFQRWSLPVTDVTPTHLNRYLDTIRIEALDGRRRTVDAKTVARYRVAIKAVFNNAAAQRIIDWNPWGGVDWSPPDGEDDLDPELVMNQHQVADMARACGEIQPRARAFVLIQGVCGLRPSEAREVRRQDLDLDAGDGDGASIAVGHRQAVPRSRRVTPPAAQGPRPQGPPGRADPPSCRADPARAPGPLRRRPP